MTRFSVVTQPGADGVVHLVVTGEVDLCTAGQIVTTTETALAGFHPTGVLVDLSGVTFLDACGLSNLIAARRLVGEHGATLRVVNAHGGARLCLTAAGLAEALCAEGPRSGPRAAA